MHPRPEASLLSRILRPALAASLPVLLVLPLPAPASAPPVTVAANCAGTSTGLVPINDLGAGTYLGVPGGLYAGGSNQRPAAHEAAGLAIANALGPVDTLGNPDPNGRVVIVSIGMSNCTQEFSAFVPKCAADPLRRAEVVAIDCAHGGQTASVIRNPNAWYWDTVATRLRGRGSAPAQVQVVWFKEANAQPTGNFPTSNNALLDDYAGAIRTLKDELPNVKLAYLTSRIYAGYASTALNPEPYAYESAFAVRRLISAQAGGVDSLNYDAGQGPVEAPWLSWGPYLWADGLTPRSDGLTWACSEFASDGTHPGTPARNKVADSLLAFFRADATTVPWYRVASTGVPAAEVATTRLVARPVPASGAIALSVTGPRVAGARLEIVDAGGRRVRTLGADATTWDLRDDSGKRVRPGVYWARLHAEGPPVTARLVVR